MKYCLYSKNCPYIDDCEDCIIATTAEDVAEEMTVLAKGRGDCQVSRERDMQKEELISLLRERQRVINDLRDKVANMDDRYQSDCIEVNRLNTALDVMVEKYQRLRELKGL